MNQIDIEVFGKKLAEYSGGGVIPVICYFKGSATEFEARRVELYRGWEKLRFVLLKNKIVVGAKPSVFRRDCNGTFPRVKIALTNDHFRMDPVWPETENSLSVPVIFDIDCCLSAATTAGA